MDLSSETAGFIVGALPMPVVIIGPAEDVLFANPAAEQFFGMGASVLTRQRIADIVPPASPIIELVAQARERNATVSERGLDLSTPRRGDRSADVIATPLAGHDGVVILTLQERSFAQRLDRQLLHRDAVRSMHGMAAVLAHEIKNPLAGIRGAAQLVEESVPAEDRHLTQLIV